MNKFAFALAAAAFAVPAAAAVTVPSTPALFDSVGDSFSISLGDGYLDGVQQPGLDAAATFRLSGLAGGGTAWTFTIDNLANLSGGSVLKSRLSSFGFDIKPLPKTATLQNATATGLFDIADFDAPGPGPGDPSISSGIKVDVCFRDAGGNCSGGGSGGLWNGEAIPNGAFPNNTFTLTFDTSLTSLTLDYFVARFQSIDTRDGVKGGSGVAVGGDGPIDPGGGAVPEPSSWAMLIAGFGLVGAVSRRRKNARLTVTA